LENPKRTLSVKLMAIVLREDNNERSPPEFGNNQQKWKETTKEITDSG